MFVKAVPKRDRELEYAQMACFGNCVTASQSLIANETSNKANCCIFRQCVQVLRSQPKSDLSSSSFPDDIRDPLLLGPKPELKISTLDAKLEEADEILKQTIMVGGKGRKKKQAPNPEDPTQDSSSSRSTTAQNGTLPIYDEIVIEKE